jgi:hypothetical protein
MLYCGSGALGKLWKTTISVLMHPENPCGAMAPSAVAGVFQNLLRLGSEKILCLGQAGFSLGGSSG